MPNQSTRSAFGLMTAQISEGGPGKVTAKSSPDLYFLCPHPELLSNLTNRLQT